MYASFDIEVAKSFPSDEEISSGSSSPPYHLPISCSSIAIYSPKSNIDTMSFGVNDSMSPAQVREFVGTLSLLNSMGYLLISWNGLGFDFRCLSHWASMGLHPFLSTLWREEVAFLARTHIDPAFLMLCQMGYMISLDATAKALGLEGKMEGMEGPLAPLLWSGLTGKESRDTLTQIANLGVVPGSLEARSLCQNYVIQDAITTMEVYLGLMEISDLHWITARGRTSRSGWTPLRDEYGDLLSVNEASTLPLPDTSWMSHPRPRSEYLSWIDDSTDDTDSVGGEQLVLF